MSHLHAVPDTPDTNDLTLGQVAYMAEFHGDTDWDLYPNLLAVSERIAIAVIAEYERRQR